MGIYITKGEDYNIKKDAIVKVTRYEATGNMQVQHIKHKNNNLSNTIRISKTEYIDKVSGEIKKYKIKENKNNDGIHRSMKKLQQIIKNNFSGAKSELFITLTTDKQVTDIDIMKDYFKSFWQKLKRKYKELEYIFVFELQTDRNSWHIHALLKDKKNKYLYIDNEKIVKKLWGKGNTWTSKITKKKKSNETNIEKQIQGQETLGIEGLTNYMAKIRSKENIPVGKQAYCKSRGIKVPKQYTAKYEEVNNEIGNEY